MKKEFEEMIAFPVTQYSCDVCGTELLKGAKPLICVVCGRELCRSIYQCYHLTYLENVDHNDRSIICRECHKSEARHGEAIRQEFLRHYDTIDQFMKQWQAESKGIPDGQSSPCV